MRRCWSFGWAIGLIIGNLPCTKAEAGIHLPVPYMAQPDNQTCFPTSFMMALNYMGRIDEFSSATIQELHKSCQYNRFNAPGIASKFNLHALPNWHNLGWTTETIKAELDLGRPVILGVNQGRNGHFILAIGYTDDGKVIVHDPSTTSLGYTVKGPNQVAEWKDLLWRGGVILRPEPFPEPPPLSGVAIGEDDFPLESTINKTMISGDDTEVSFTLVNNGRVAWPKDLYLVAEDPDSSPTLAVNSAMKLGWLRADTPVKLPESVQPGTTVTVSFRVKAPQSVVTTTYLQYFNLRDGSGNWFGTNWLTGPGNRNMGVRLLVIPKERPESKLPLVENGKNNALSLPWQAKVGKLSFADDLTTPPPSGSPAIHLLTANETHDAAWVGDYAWTDYRVEANIYCEMRTEQRFDGWERVGIFARDCGNHMLDSKTEVEIGSGLMMCFDGDDGSIRAGYAQNGSIGDFRDERFKLTESGWHKFAITCKGNTVEYELDGKPFHTERTRSYKTGDCGVFYNSAFKPELPEASKAHGVYFSDFKVTE